MICLAKALYDNPPESGDELALKRGDVLEVLEKDYNGLAGWWLCSFKGDRGIVPGNRLRILTALPPGDDGPPLSPSQSSDVQWNRRSWHFQPNKVCMTIDYSHK